MLDMEPISIHALHEESDHTTLETPHTHMISIHALHEESDDDVREHGARHHISIHALHEESDLIIHERVDIKGFQSTLSMRRATDTRP